jgi:ribosomal protein S18 acetylase RimI-like enzyme
MPNAHDRRDLHPTPMPHPGRCGSCVRVERSTTKVRDPFQYAHSFPPPFQRLFCALSLRREDTDMDGSCLCGAIRYEIDDLDGPINHCSCRTCRKAHAAAFTSTAAVDRAHFRWLAGQDKLSSFESSPAKLRYFCSVCGSHLVAERAVQSHVILRVATLDDDPGQKPALAIWRSHEVPWLDYGPGVPGFAELAPAPRMLIKRAGSQDVQAVRRLVREAYAQWIPVIGREPMPMKADYERAVQDHEIDLLYSDGNLVACIEVILLPDHLFIENIAVIPHRQGQGLGRRLLRHAEEKARNADLHELRLLTNQAFEANIRLYEAVGFQIDRTEPFAGGGSTVYMSKAIAPVISC